MQIPVYRYIKTKEGWEKCVFKKPHYFIGIISNNFPHVLCIQITKKQNNELYKKMNTEESLKKKPQIVSQKMINLRNPLDLDKYSK